MRGKLDVADMSNDGRCMSTVFKSTYLKFMSKIHDPISVNVPAVDVSFYLIQ